MLRYCRRVHHWAPLLGSLAWNIGDKKIIIKNKNKKNKIKTKNLGDDEL